MNPIDRLVWQALDHSHSVRSTQPHLASVFSATRGIIFLGTPHRGSGKSSLAKVVASVARLAFQNTNSKLIRDLEGDGQTLDRIKDSFSRILDGRTLMVWSFVEELPVVGVGMVCTSNAAISYLILLIRLLMVTRPLSEMLVKFVTPFTPTTLAW